MGTQLLAPLALIVDDDFAVVRSLCRWFPHAHSVADNPFEGLRIAQELQPAVVLLDNYFPSGPVLDLLCVYRQQAPNSKLFLMSGIIDPNDARAAYAVGVHGVYSKADLRPLRQAAIRIIEAASVHFRRRCH